MKEICRLGIKASLLPHIYKWQNYLHRKNATYNIFVVVSTVLIRVLQLQSTYSKYLTFIRVKNRSYIEYKCTLFEWIFQKEYIYFVKFYSILHVSILIEFIGTLYALITHLFLYFQNILSAGVQKVSLQNRYEDNEPSFIQMVWTHQTSFLIVTFYLCHSKNSKPSVAKNFIGFSFP